MRDTEWNEFMARRYPEIRAAIFPVNGYACGHGKLNGAAGQCPDCGWSVQVYNPYGHIDTKPQRAYSEREIKHGKAIARAIG